MHNGKKHFNINKILEAIRHLPVNELSFPEIALHIINLFIDNGIGDVSSIFLKDEKSNTLYLVAARDKERRAFTASNIKLYNSAVELPFKWYFKEGEGIAGTAHLNKKPIFVKDLEREKRFIGKQGMKKQLFVLPLLIGQQSIGILNIASFQNNLQDEKLRDDIERLSTYFASIIQYSKIYSKYLTNSFLLTSLINYTDKAIIVLDKEDRIIDINSSASRIIPMKIEDIKGLSISSFNPQDEEKLKGFLKKAYSADSFIDKEIYSKKGMISRIPFDDLDNKVVIKAIKEFPDGSLQIFDIVKLKVLNKNEESIGSIEIWSLCDTGIDQKQTKAPIFDNSILKKVISRLKLIINELKTKKVDTNFIQNHIESVSKDLKSLSIRKNFTSLNSLINVSINTLSDYNNLNIQWISNIPDDINAKIPPYKIIQLFYLILEIIAKFGNIAEYIKIKYLSGDKQNKKHDIHLKISNKDLHIPKHFMHEFQLQNRELYLLLKECKGTMDIIKEDNIDIISLTLNNSLQE